MKKEKPTFPGTEIPITKEIRHAYNDKIRAMPDMLTEIKDKAKWPTAAPHVQQVWESKEFLAVIYLEREYLRLSVNRVAVDWHRGQWKDGITWDQLMQIKSDIGLGQFWAVEVYPPDDKVVMVANLRHLWLLDAPPPYAWNSQQMTAVDPKDMKLGQKLRVKALDFLRKRS